MMWIIVSVIVVLVILWLMRPKPRVVFEFGSPRKISHADATDQQHPGV
jgi:hypothetical protein